MIVLLAGLWGGVLGVLDLRRRWLPNWLTVGGGIAFLGGRLAVGGWPAAIDGFAAGTVAGAFLLWPVWKGGAGSGDLKMLCAAGVLAGWSRLLGLLWFMSLAGLVLAVVMLVFNRADGARLKHYGRCLVDWRYDRKAGAATLPPRDCARVRVPFGVAISVGLVVALWVRP